MGPANHCQPVAAKDKFVQGRSESLTDVLEFMTSLVEFYPRHIEKEDQHFFLPVMEYFSRGGKRRPSGQDG